jgi:hypothetical protein
MLKNVVISNIDNEPDLSYNVTPPPYQLNEFIITEQEVLDQLNILNINKPGGPDGIVHYQYWIY